MLILIDILNTDIIAEVGNISFFMLRQLGQGSSGELGGCNDRKVRGRRSAAFQIGDFLTAGVGVVDKYEIGLRYLQQRGPILRQC